MALLSLVVEVYAESAGFSHWLAVDVAVFCQVSVCETAEALLELSPVLEFFMTLSWYEKVVFHRLHGAGAL